MRHLDSYYASVGSLNVGTVTGREGEFADVVERLECCVCGKLDGKGT